jgi:energy-coupling factor transporter ATP-binding protein EcfA2
MKLRSLQDFQGLKLTADVDLGSNIAAIVGRNGSGKTRLLRAIAEGRIEASVNDVVIPVGGIRLLTINELQPGLIFGFDPVQHREQERQAVAQYNLNKGKFDIDPQRTIATIGNQVSMWHHNLQIGFHQVAQIASRASKALGKDVNELNDADIADFFASSGFAAVGTLNVTATMRAYWDRMEQNTKYAENHPYWTPSEFLARLGPPPWEVLNEVLFNILDGRYQFETPTRFNIATYDGRLYRSEDRLTVDPAWLSSGEKVLMWLCLTMYAPSSGRGTEPPQLLLLDEPDSALHPQMVQKLHLVLNSITAHFGTSVIFTTHSPTSVALFNAGLIWQVSERDLLEVDKDAAISELLVGLDQINVHYTKCRQVYVESHKDEDIYKELFFSLRRWNKGVSEHIALTFIPAAPKLAPQNIRDILTAHLGELDRDQTEALIGALNGQGSCAQVVGAVESLNAQDGVPVRGIIDWDFKNRPTPHIYVLGEKLFYNIENAILNPLTLGIYLLHNFSGKLEAMNYGLDDGFDPLSLYMGVDCWQSVADGVTRRVLNVLDVSHDLECRFLAGGHVYFDKRLVHMNGHELETRLRQADVYPFLNAFTRRPTLMQDVIQRGIQPSQGRTMPQAFVDIFNAIQVGD